MRFSSRARSRGHGSIRLCTTRGRAKYPHSCPQRCRRYDRPGDSRCSGLPQVRGEPFSSVWFPRLAPRSGELGEVVRVAGADAPVTRWADAHVEHPGEPGRRTPATGDRRGVGAGHPAPGCVSGGADKYPRKVPRRKAGVLLVRAGDTFSRHGAWFVRTGPCAFSRVRSRRGWCSQPLPLPSAGTLDRATPAILCLVKAHGWPVVTGRADREQGQAHLPAKQP